MYKSVFQSSKMALLFAGMTLVSAISMIGTEEDQGLLTETVERIEERAAASGGTARGDAVAEGGGVENSRSQPVFGDYVAEAAPPPPSGGNGNGGAAQFANPMDAPLSPNAVVVPYGAPLPSGLSGEEGAEAPAEPE